MTRSSLFHRPLLYGFLACLGFILTSCAQPPRRLEPADLFWPPLPDRPRIQYVQSIYTEDDIGRSYSFSEKLFGKGYFDGMVRPYGVSARSDRLLITDIITKRVLVFDLARKRLVTVLGNDGAFRMPASAVSDSKGKVYVADSNGAKVAVYDSRGSYATAFLVEGGVPVGLAINEELGRLYVVDRRQHRIVVFSLEGERLFEFGGRGTDDGRFNIPLAVTVDRAGTVYVVDNGNFRVQMFTAEGVFLRAFGQVGDRPGMFANPKAVAVDGSGHIYVTDAAFSNFQIFDQQGRILLHVGEMGMIPGYFHLPAGIAIDEKDHIYVADQINSRVQVFRYLKDQQDGSAL